MRSVTVSLVGTLLVAACAEPSTTALSPNTGEPLYAKPAPTVADPSPTFSFPTSILAGLGGDGLYVNSRSAASVYASGVCGVTTRLFVSSESASGDATLQTDNPTAQDKKCPSYPRKFTLRYASDNGSVVDTRAGFMNLREIARVGYAMAVGETRDRILALTLSGTGTGCNALRWSPLAAGNQRASYVEVTRTDARTYSVKSKAGGLAYCVDNGLTYDLPVDFTVVSDRDLPQ